MFSTFRCRVVSPATHLSFSDVRFPQADPGFGPFSHWSLESRFVLTPSPPICPPPPTEQGQEIRGGCRSAGRGRGVCKGFGCVWLTCLMTLGNGCLDKVLDFLVLLQKTLQKPGSLLHSNSKASSKPLLPCMDRNTQDQRQAHTCRDWDRTVPGRSHHTQK